MTYLDGYHVYVTGLKIDKTKNKITFLTIMGKLEMQYKQQFDEDSELISKMFMNPEVQFWDTNFIEHATIMFSKRV